MTEDWETINDSNEQKDNINKFEKENMYSIIRNSWVSFKILLACPTH